MMRSGLTRSMAQNGLDDAKSWALKATHDMPSTQSWTRHPKSTMPPTNGLQSYFMGNLHVRQERERVPVPLGLEDFPQMPTCPHMHCGCTPKG